MNELVSKRLRLVSSGYEDHSGEIGAYQFVNGVSVESIPKGARMRLSAAFQMTEINEDGSEEGASPAEKLVALSGLKLPPVEKFAVMTEAQKSEEDLRVIVGGIRVPVLHTVAALEKIADNGGIADLRLVATEWNVRSKSIPTLIEMIMKAQNGYVSSMKSSLLSQGVAESVIDGVFVFKDEPVLPASKPIKKEAAESSEDFEETPEPFLPNPYAAKTAEPESDIGLAAAAGDMSAALNAE